MADENRRFQIELGILLFAWVAMIGTLIATAEPTEAIEPTPTPIVTLTPTPTATPTPPATNTPTPTSTPTNTPTPSPTVTPTEAPKLIEPTFEEVEYMAKVIHGEATGCTDLQKSAVAWCVCNRVDCADYPDTVIEVITQPYQFHGYKDTVVADESDYAIAWGVLYRWYNDLEGRTLPKRFLFFHSSGKGYNVFTTDYRKGEEWDFSLPNIYE